MIRFTFHDLHPRTLALARARTIAIRWPARMLAALDEHARSQEAKTVRVTR